MLSINKVNLFTTLNKKYENKKILNPIKILINSLINQKIPCINTLLSTKSFDLNITKQIVSNKNQITNLQLTKLYLNKKNKKNLLNFFNKNKLIYIQLQSCLILFNFFKNSNFLSEVKFNIWWKSNLNRNYFLTYQSLFLTIGLNNHFVLDYFKFFFYKRLKKRYEPNTYFVNFEKSFKKPSLVVSNPKLIYTKSLNYNSSELPNLITNGLYNDLNSFILQTTLVHHKNNLKNQLLFSYWSFLKQLLTLKKLKKTKSKLIFIFVYNHFYFYNFIKLSLDSKVSKESNLIFTTKVTLNINKINFLTTCIWLQTIFTKQPKLRRSTQRRLKYHFLINFFSNYFNKKAIRPIKNNQLKNFIFLFSVVFFFKQVFSYILTKSKHIKKSNKMVPKVFITKWFLKRKKHKRHYYRGRFFYLKKKSKKIMFKRFKKNSFIKKIVKFKQFLTLKNTLLKSYKTTKHFNNYLLSSFSYKFLLIYTLLLTPQFRRYMGIISKIFSQVKTNTLQSHFNSYISLDGKWSNIIPFFYLPDNTKKLIKKETTKPMRESYLVYLRQYFGGFFEFLLKRKIFLKITTKLKITINIKKIFLYLYNKHRNYQYNIGRGFFFQEMLFVCWYSFFSKDLSFLMTWLTRLMNKIDYKKHRRLLKILKSILLRYKYFFLLLNKVEGFKFGIKGKLGVKGNAKKRIMEFTVRNTSFSKKKNRIEYQQGLVYTETGVLGVTMVLAF